MRNLFLFIALVVVGFVNAQESDWNTPHPNPAQAYAEDKKQEKEFEKALNTQIEKPADPNNFEQMTSEQIKSEVLSAKGIESGLYKQYIAFKSEYNKWLKQEQNNKRTADLEKRAKEWEGWNIESKTVSRSGGKLNIFTTYSKRLDATKMIYVAVHIIDGVEKSRTRHYMNL